MNLINRLAEFFKQRATQSKNTPPEGYCPNCRGKQEYDNQIRELYKDK